MIIDGRAVSANSVFQAAYCVIGSGMGGAALSHSLAQAGKDVLLIEAGGLDFSTNGAPENITAEYTGRPFGISRTRSISLGGTSNLWHGVSNPLDEIDFAPRTWLDESGWPISRADLDPFYRSAAALLGHNDCLGLEPGRIPPAARRALQAIRFDSSILQQKLMEYRKRPHRWQASLLRLANDGKLRCLLSVAALELVPSECGTRVLYLRCAAPGRTIRIQADVFILSAGALETPRLLLNSRSLSPSGIGNDSDLVGRYLMDHPNGPFSMLRFSLPTIANAYSSLPLNSGHRLLRVSLTLRPEHQAAASIPNHYFTIRPCITSRNVSPELRLSLLDARRVRDLTLRQLSGIFGSANVFYRILITRCHLPAIYHYGELFIMAEQLPSMHSRVTLSATRKDSFGYPIASVNWQILPRDFSCFEAFIRLAFDQGLRSPQYKLALKEAPERWSSNLTSAAHHLGTARMGDRPATGVVDRDLRVFGLKNLYICDGSVFRTSGSANPSLTITALALRLADHLQRQTELGGQHLTKAAVERVAHI